MLSSFVAFNIVGKCFKKRVRKIIKRIPIPPVTLSRLKNLRNALFPIRHKTYVHIVLRRIVLQVCNAHKLDIFYFNSRPPSSFSSRAFFKRFHVFKMPAGKRVLSFAMRTLAFSQKNFAVFENHDADSYFWIQCFIHDFKNAKPCRANNLRVSSKKIIEKEMGTITSQSASASGEIGRAHA